MNRLSKTLAKALFLALLPLYSLAADQIIFKDKAGRVLTKSDLDAAVGTFNWEIADHAPVSREAREEHALGRAAGQHGDYKSAFAHFANASKMAPQWLYPPYDTAFTHLLQRNFSAAYDYYRQVDRMAPRGYFTTKTAVSTLRMEADGEIPTGTYLRYLSLEWESNQEKVKLAAQAMTREIPTFAPAWKSAAAFESDPQKRLVMLEGGLKANPDAETKGFLLLNKALVLSDLKNAEEAKQILGSLALDPNSPRDVEAAAKFTLAQISKR